MSPTAPARETSPSDTVVLLHGLGRTSASMARLAHALEADGYRVLNLSYPSRTRTLEEIATHWLPARLASLAPSNLPDRSANTPRVHMVTHSMSGIVVRLWLRECGAPPNLGRVVMLAPPNAGSEISDRLEAWRPFHWVTGVNGGRLTTAADALPATLGPWPQSENPGSLGVIAGNRPMNALMATWLPGPNDGKVTVARTHLAGEADHLVLPYSHTWLAWRGETITQVKAFLRAGRFEPVRAAAPN